MKYFEYRFNTVLQLIHNYTYPQPFHLYLANYFKANKKFGSKDRKAVSSLAYAYWRVKGICEGYNDAQSLLIGCYLYGYCTPPDWNKLSQTHNLPAHSPERDNFIERFNWLNDTFSLRKELFADYTLSLELPTLTDLLQFRPLIWLNARGTGADSHPELDKTPLLETARSTKQWSAGESSAYQIQDLSSQLICSRIAIPSGSKVWDCCSGAGGKSIPLVRPDLKFYLSDKRTNILRNAQRRFKRFGLKANWAVYDHAQGGLPEFSDGEQHEFDVIIADVPCSGSGTWFRNPEHFSGFKSSQLKEYTAIQAVILQNATKLLAAGGTLYFLTCSVFQAENENNVHYAESALGLKCIEQSVINGFDQGSDSLFFAAFTKSHAVHPD